MGTETERRFLVGSNEWRALATGVPYEQAYMRRDKGRTVRVRIAGDEAFLTIKGATAADGISHPEYEYKIPKSDAREMLDTLCLPGNIEKTRSRVPFGGMVWEVDEFKGANAGLLIAEVEMPSADYALKLPAWVGAEITGDGRYSNAELSKTPYSQWKQDVKKCQTPTR